MKRITPLLMITATLLLSSGCGGNQTESAETGDKKPVQSMIADPVDPMDNPGVGPVQSLSLNDEIDMDMVSVGEEKFKTLCSACHKPTKKHIGPAPLGIFERRNPAWVMNMILNPEGMIKDDPIAKKLLVEYNGAPMANQNVSEADARAIVEYFRTLNVE